MSIYKLLLSCVFTLVISGCGGGGGGSSSEPVGPPPPTYVTKDYTITMSEASVKRISNGDPVDLSIEGIEASGTVVVTQ